MKTYALRLTEQALACALGGAVSAWAASGYSLTQAAFGAAIGAGLRAVWGMVAQPFGDKESPSVTK